MLSPTMTVVVLAVLWLIVVVPMLFRRHDEGERERSVDRFGRSMRALGRRAPRGDAEVFVAGRAPQRSAEPAAPAVSTRRAVPAAEEALMYPVDPAEMSEARAAMMARRRRSLTVLGLGTLILVPVALATGGITWLVALPFALGLLGYLWFLRSQAQRDRDRRQHRQERAVERRTRGVDLTSERRSRPAPRRPMSVPEPAESIVRIDDDDIALHNMDTIDLTGLYNDELATSTTERRAS